MVCYIKQYLIPFKNRVISAAGFYNELCKNSTAVLEVHILEGESRFYYFNCVDFKLFNTSFSSGCLFTNFLFVSSNTFLVLFYQVSEYFRRLQQINSFDNEFVIAMIWWCFHTTPWRKEKIKTSEIVLHFNWQSTPIFTASRPITI